MGKKNKKEKKKGKGAEKTLQKTDKKLDKKTKKQLAETGEVQHMHVRTDALRAMHCTGSTVQCSIDMQYGWNFPYFFVTSGSGYD
jgi:mannose-6-phosphate isomerase-like protein (cupin superfamily)